MELAIPRWCVASPPGYHPGEGGASVPSPWTIEPALTSRRDDALDALMAAAVAGDARAFEALYRALAPRVRGFLRNLSGDDRAADDYFTGRPRGSQIGAWASPQSQVLRSREELEARVEAAERQFADVDVVPRPPNWGGYCIEPDYFEFWQGRPSRLHDRLRYVVGPDGHWKRDRLAP